MQKIVDHDFRYDPRSIVRMASKGSVSEWFEEGHRFVYGSVFLPVVEDV